MRSIIGVVVMYSVLEKGLSLFAIIVQSSVVVYIKEGIKIIEGEGIEKVKRLNNIVV